MSTATAERPKTKPPMPKSGQTKWFLTDDPKTAAKLGATVVDTWTLADERRINDLSYWARLYGTASLSFSGSLKTRVYNTRSTLLNPLAATYNGCKTVVDTVSNTVAQHKPVAQFTATDGDWKSHKVAKQRARFIAGWFYEQEIYKRTVQAFLDSAVWGVGILHVYAKNGRAVTERVFPGDLFIDQTACTTNETPREMARIRLMDRWEAWAMFEGNEEAQAAIMRAEKVQISVNGWNSDTSEIIQLNELWRLPSHPKASDGKHLLATTTEPLKYEPWTRPTFPFAMVVCSPQMFGYWPQGMVEPLANVQLQYNELSFVVNEAQRLGGGFQLWVDSTSSVVVESMTNEIGGVMRGNGKPTSLLYQLVQPELYERLEKLERMFFTLSGVAQMVAAPDPDKDPRASGIAIRSRVAIYDERHALWVQSYQDMHLALGKLAIQTVEEIIEAEKAAKEDGTEEEKRGVGSYEVYSTNGPQSDPIDFKDLKFKPNEQYVLTCMPVADLPDTIEGRVALAQEFVQNGWYDEATARQVFLAPYDTARVETFFNASREYFGKVLDAAVEDGTPVPEPESTDNLPLALNMALQQLMYAKNRGVAEGRCDLIRDFIKLVVARQKLPPTATPANGPGTPLADPQAPPTSELLPNPNAAAAPLAA